MNVTCILTQVDEYLERSAKRSQRVDAGYFHPSSLSNRCSVAIALDFLGYQKADSAVDARVQRIFSIGHGIDRAWKERLKKSGLSIVGSAEFPTLKMVVPEWRIRGECDDIIEISNASGMDSLRVIAEVKSINQRGFDGELPLAEHVIQTHCYMKGHGLFDAVVIYENKNDSQVKVIHVPWDEAVWNDIQRRIVNVIELIQSGALATFRDCKYGCDYGDACRKYDAEDGLNRLHALEVIR